MSGTKYRQYVYINHACCDPPHHYHGPCNPFICHPHPHGRQMKGALSELNSGDPIFYFKHKMDGSVASVFHRNIIDLLDRVFAYDGLRFLSEDQERYFSEYFSQAGVVTDKINKDIPDPFNNMDQTFIDLDTFLGSYLGVDHGSYTR